VVGVTNPFQKLIGGLIDRSKAVKTASATLEEKLEALAKCGLHLDPQFTVDDLLESWPREQFEKPGFGMARIGLGMTEERPPWRNHCFNVWHFDRECIEDHGDYERIAMRMMEMAQGSLPIERIEDFVDVCEKVAWLKLQFQGREIHIDCRVEDDWVDPRLFGRFVELLHQSDPTKLFLYFDLEEQACILACTTQLQFEELKRAGVKFEPLSGKSLM
jgi:hypothetical protein